MLTTIFAFLLFTMEWYHIWGHCLILFRIRLLPRKDLVRIRPYFLVDLFTVFCSSILFLGKLQWLACIQMAQHLYYFVYWDQTFFAKKIVNWSCLDWVKSDFRNRWELDNIFGTLFDVVVHVLMAYHLGAYLTAVQVVVALVVVQAGVFLVLFGPYYAWASPNNIPPWIQKRINPEKLKEC